MKITNMPHFLRNPNPELYLSDNYIVLDFETTNLDKGSALNNNNKIVLSVWKHTGSKLHHSWNNEFDLEELTKAVEQADFLVAHNAKFELQWLARCGLDLSNVLVYDTMIGEYVIGGNRWKYGQLSLDKIAKKYGLGGKESLVSKLIKQGVCPSEIPTEWLHRYCEQDVRLTENLFLLQREQLLAEKKLAVQFTRCLLTPVLADIETNGMQLDTPKVEEAYKKAQKLEKKLTIELNKIAVGVNWSSPQQVAELVYGDLGFEELKDRSGNEIRTPTGKAKADKETLPKLKARTAEQKKFLELYGKCRGARTQLSKYLEKFKECCDESGGLLQASFNQTATSTHRLSSSGKTQFQNFPRIYKHFFKARHEGWGVGESDGAQLEFRVAVHLGRDRQGLADILNDIDIHSFSAGIIFGAKKNEMEESEYKRYRQNSKEHTFKPLYGGTSGTPKERKYYKFFRERYTDITNTQNRWIDTVLTRKSLVTEWGMEYFWPDTKITGSGYVVNTTSICNYPVQALATAEIIPIALVYFWHKAKRLGLKLFVVNTIHDSIIAEVPPDEEDIFHELSKQCLIDDVYPYLSKVYNINFTAPLGCETKIGEFWSTGKEKVYQADEELYKSSVV